MASLLKDWDRTIQISSVDSDEAFTVKILNAKVVDIAKGNQAETNITLRGTEEILVDVFNGILSPAFEFLEGRIDVDADDKDQVKLDALALVLWD